jgi:hypothetical protein
MLRSAPSLETPLPLRVSASAPTLMPPCNCRGRAACHGCRACCSPSADAFEC